MHDNSDNPPPDDEVSEGAQLTGSEHSIEREQPAVSADSSLLWNSRFGQGVSRLSQPHLRAAVRRFHGDLVVWAGSQPSACQVLDNCMLRNRLYMGLGNTIPTPVHNSSDMVMFSRVEELPLPSRSVDGVVLHYALEQAEDPRTALREVTRVLVPGGRLVLAGFNPFSLLGFKRLYAKLYEDPLSGHRLVNPLRLFEWLAALGYELQAAPLYYGGPLPFVDLAEGWQAKKLSHLSIQARDARTPPHQELRLGQPGQGAGVWPFGGLMLLEARKQAHASQMPRLRRRQPRKLGVVAYPRVASWQRKLPAARDTAPSVK